MVRILAIAAVAVMAGACAAAQAKAPVVRPALDVPPVPPRVVEAQLQTEPPPPPEPVPDLPAAPVVPRPRPQRETAPRTEIAKPDPPAVDPPAAPAPIAPAVPPLRAPGSPSAADAARQVREIIDRARKTLESVDYRTLKNELRVQYDNAKLLLQQADDTFKAANYELARNLADKGERIAKELQGR
jgi:outer membrane biosynthesis protein TonB